jgi:hypothetical protein
VTSFQKESLSKQVQGKKIEPFKSGSSAFVTQRDRTRIAPKHFAMPPALLLNEKCSISTKTLRSAPDGTPDTRTTVGVGEEVQMTARSPATWAAARGSTVAPSAGTTVIWTAPAIPMTTAVNATLATGTKCSCIMSVEAPKALSLTKVAAHFIPKWTAGVCMRCAVTVLPRNVCLGATRWLEMPGPATAIEGYFAQRFFAGKLNHRPYSQYVEFNDNNLCKNWDHAAFEDLNDPLPEPFWKGRFMWKIRNKYKLDNESDSSGREFATTFQLWRMLDDFGTLAVNKAGASASRRP